MKEGKAYQGILSTLFLIGALALPSCAAPVATLPVTTLINGAQLALTGGDIYRQMGLADGRTAFEMGFEEAWDHALSALQGLAFEIEEFGTNEANDGGLIQAKSLTGKIRVAVIKLSEEVSEIGIWTRKDPALAELILDRIRREAERDAGPGREWCAPTRPYGSFPEPLPPPTHSAI